MRISPARREALLELLAAASVEGRAEHVEAVERLRSGSPLRADLGALQCLAADWLMYYGFGDDWEPNEFGLAMEDLIDILAPWHWGYYD
jgi:hypothetical protein